LQELKDELSSTDVLIQKLTIFINTLKLTQSQLRVSLIDNINLAMDDVWSRLYPYSDFASARIEIVNGDYEVLVKEQAGDWVRVEGILSGGERSAAALTLRIALSLVLTQNLSWLILDEPTHNLDTGTVKQLSGMMRQHLPELVEQIFVITHDKEMEKAASAMLYFLERNKGEDGVTKPVLQQIE
jgi:DNA repair exonuclease SbcCD ATPase subunit